MAVATPAMLPVPVEAPSPVMKAWKGESVPRGPEADELPGRRIRRSASGSRRSCGKPYRIESRTPVPSRSAIVQGPQTRLEAAVTAFVMLSVIALPVPFPAARILFLRGAENDGRSRIQLGAAADRGPAPRERRARPALHGADRRAPGGGGPSRARADARARRRAGAGRGARRRHARL